MLKPTPRIPGDADISRTSQEASAAGSGRFSAPGRTWLAGLAGVLFGTLPLSAQEGEDGGEGNEQAAEEAQVEASDYPKEVEPGTVRYRFPLERDAEGQSWGVSGEGIIGWSSGCLKSAMQLKVDGAEFVAEAAEERERGHYVIEGKAGDVGVTRDIRLDRERGVVRYWDRFRGAGSDAAVEYLTVPLGTPVELLTNSGAKLGKRLGEDEFGLLLRNDPGELGRTSAVFVLGGTRDVSRPAVLLSDGPLLKVGYRLKLPADEEKGLVTLVGQRALDAGGDVKGVFRGLFWRHSLFGARIPAAEAAAVANFPAQSLSGEGVLAPHADDLVGVVGIEQRLGVERSISDILWVSGDSQLTGEAGGGEVNLTGALGEVKVGFSEVAAMQGGGGLGRQHRLYLRDGTVLSGTVSVDNLRVSGTQGWRIEADLEQLDHLLLRLSEEDGMAPEGTGMFVKLHSGDVLPLGIEDVPLLPFVTPWGAVDVPADQIEVMVYVSAPTPRYRLVLKDGTRLTGFVGEMELSGDAGVVGRVSIELSSIEALWPAGAMPNLEVGEFDEAESFDELEPPVDTDADFCLLRGGNLLSGRLGGGEIHLLTGTTVTAVAADEIVELRREDDDPGELMPAFRVELAGGHVLNGKLREEFVTLETPLRSWSLPVQHFVGARRGEIQEGGGQ